MAAFMSQQTQFVAVGAAVAAAALQKNPKVQEYRDIFDEAKDRRESWLVRKMAADPKAANGCMNALKQEANGGYMDRAGGSGEITLKVKSDGVGGMHAFD